MQRKIIVAAFSMLCMLASCGRVVIKGEGNIKTETRESGSFSSIKIAAPIKARITVQEGASSVSLSGYENLLKHIIVKVNGSTLEISTDALDMDVESDKELIANISLPSLKELKLKGSVTAEVKGDVKGSRLTCDISGGTALNIASVNVTDLDVDISGAGELGITNGTADKVSYAISGAGKIYSYGLQANNVIADVSGAGDIQLTALKSLDVEISGAGNISYKGNPAIKKDISGAGALNAAN